MKHLLGKLRAGRPATIVAVGDSNTELTFHTRGHLNWVGLLCEALFETYGPGICTLINTARCGARIGDALATFDRDVIRHQPDLVILSLGMNDALGGLAQLDAFGAQVRDFVARVRAGCASEILIRTPNPVVGVHGVPIPGNAPPGTALEFGERTLAPYAAALAALAGELDCALVDHYRLWSTRQFSFRNPVADPTGLWPRMADAIHPGHLGHLAFFRELAPLFAVAEYFPWEEHRSGEWGKPGD